MKFPLVFLFAAALCVPVCAENPAGAAASRITFFAPVSLIFFFGVLTGLMITIGAIITLGILMATTAKVNWSDKFSRKTVPPPLESHVV